MPAKPAPEMPYGNSSPEMAEKCVEVMKRFQDLGRDLEVLRDHLRKTYKAPGADARITATLLSSVTLSQSLILMLITALMEETGE